MKTIRELTKENLNKSIRTRQLTKEILLTLKNEAKKREDRKIFGMWEELKSTGSELNRTIEELTEIRDHLKC